MEVEERLEKWEQRRKKQQFSSEGILILSNLEMH